MADLTSKALRLARSQHGVITTSQLVGAGVSRTTIRRLEGAEVLVGDYKSVRRIASSERTLEQRCAELCLAHPKTFITGATAGQLYGLRRMPQRSPIILSSAHPLHLVHDGVRQRRSTKVSASDIVRRLDGIRLAQPTRLAFDLAAELADRDHRSVLDQLVHEHGVTVPELFRIAERLCHRARPGSARFTASIATLTDTPTESDAERRVADALLARGVPVETNAEWLHFPNGRRARLDLAVPSIRWGVEIDVHPSHLGVIGSTDDKRRDRQAALLGWIIVRVTSLDLLDIDALASELFALYQQRCREVAA
ncbi:MAG: type IV toxin-antitoxin system AbiEi family antitoxin domain-containing protein [Ilumatobacter sp.]|uniref:type IV toxin-antitoxin system AbiEi family antitoxin domain-containing protein n=1 Tax=Ilumatobacter sp. TaxID=1967498 RepID=UPI003C71E1CB